MSQPHHMDKQSHHLRTPSRRVLFPYDVEKEFGSKGKVPIKASFNGVPYAGSLIKYGNPQHMLPILKAIREQIGKGPGDTIEVQL